VRVEEGESVSGRGVVVPSEMGKKRKSFSTRKAQMS
jgi:hypothetical protein